MPKEGMSMSNLIYISSPYTNGDVAENVRLACEAGNELLKRGYIPFIPHLSLFWHFAFPKSWGTWMRIDLEILSRCDAVLRIGGASIGADKEVRFAEKLGLCVYYSLEELEKDEDIKAFNSLEKLIEDLHSE